jgi:tubulin--tyrosine ligase-like protein 12
MAEAKVATFEQWVALHSEIFQDYHFPVESLAPLLYRKLVDQVMDAGQFFGIDTQQDPTLIYTPADSSPLLANSQVFLCDHCWTANPPKIATAWKANDALRERLKLYLNDPPTPDADPLPLSERLAKCDGRRLDLDDLGLDLLEPLQLPTRFPQLQVLSLWGNQLTDPKDLAAVLAELPDLKGLWLQGNPLNDNEGVPLIVFSLCCQLEIFNRKFTPNYSEWALLYVANSTDPRTVANLDLSDRGITKLNPAAFARFTSLSKVDFSENKIDLSEISTVIPSLKSIRCDNPVNLPPSIVFVNDVDPETKDVNLPIPNRIWEHIQPAGPYWGLGDEVALSIHHSLTPNFAAMPCGSPSAAWTYFVFWPIRDVSPMEDVTANLFPKIQFGQLEEPLPQLPLASLSSAFKSTVCTKRPIRVFTDLQRFAEHLHSDKFVIVDNIAEADLRWIVFTEQSDFEDVYRNGIFLNQIEGESNVTIKDLMYETVRAFMGEVPWLPETFILCEPADVAQFLDRHERLKASGQSVAWVVKAFNQTRANFMVVSESPAEILRHASVDPRLTQRYIWNPLLIYGLKFDLRFIVLLKSVKPMELFAYKVFWPRLAPKRWALDEFDDYERHFTVMNYRAPDKVTHRTYVDFVEQFEIENPGSPWAVVLEKIYGVIRDLFICGCQKMVPSPYTKAAYGIDMMITNEMQPVVLECNFQPDCHRACDLCPTFVDDVFEVLFTDQPVTNPNVVQIPLQ